MARGEALERILEVFKRIEGVSNKNAEKLAYSLLRMSDEERQNFGNLIKDLHNIIKICPKCNVWYEEENCPFCENSRRNHALIMVLSDYRLIDQFERTEKYNGLYHVISDLVSVNTTAKMRNSELNQLEKRIREEKITEVILGFDANTLGDINANYVEDALKSEEVCVSKLGRGIPRGGILSQYDLSTLEESVSNRKVESGD